MPGLRTSLLWKRLGVAGLAVALLWGWQAALQHPITHVDELGKFVHVESGHSHDGNAAAGSLCDLLAALTACAAAAPVLYGQVRSEYKPLSCPTSAPRIADAPPFLSQGPPVSA